MPSVRDRASNAHREIRAVNRGASSARRRLGAQRDPWPRLRLAEFRLALFLERHGRFLVVGSVERHLLQRHRGFEQHVDAILDDLVDRQLGPADSPGWTVSELDCDLARPRQYLRAWYDMIDQPDTLRFLAFQERPADEKFLGLIDADQQRPDHGPAVARDQTDARDMGVADAGFFGHDSDVAQ